jgi:hypothetical protein
MVIARLLGPGLVAATLVVGVVEAEPWPLSSMRLFSQVRTDRSSGFEVFVDGERLHLADLGRAFRGAHHLLPRFDDMTQAERDDVCAAWATAAGQPGATVRIDRVTWTVPTGPDDVRIEVARREAWTCG